MLLPKDRFSFKWCTCCCRFSADCSVDLVWGHTTESMCIGFMAEQDKKPKVEENYFTSRFQLSHS